ncbi:MAG: hypothetical protein ABI867_06195 [Kofleriaceae bacterium]
MRTAAIFVLATACYRDSAPVAVHNADPLVIAPAVHCGSDDLDFPVIDPNPTLRLRTHSTGPLTGWTAPTTPANIPARVGNKTLLLLDEVDGGYLALYRSPYGPGSCDGDTNCTYDASLFDRTGTQRWTVALGELMSRPDHLEVQDIRLAGGVLYFNEACQSYSSGAHGECSALVAVDPVRASVLWRTRPLVSNGRFAIRGCYIVAGYGFTAEPDALHLVDRATGRVLRKLPVSSAPQRYLFSDPNELAIQLHSGKTRRYQLKGFDSRSPAMDSLDRPEAMGGATYGGRRP